MTVEQAPTTNGAIPEQPDGFADRARTGTPTDEDIVWASEAARHVADARELANLTEIARLERVLAARQRLATRHRQERGDPTLSPPGTPELTLLSDLTIDYPGPHLLNIIAPAGATLIYGKGGVGKGSYLSHLALRLVREHHQRVLIIDAEKRPYEWKPRILALGATEPEQALIMYCKPNGPIWDQIAAIWEATAEFHPTITLVDSVARACQTDLSTGDDSIPARYYEALDQITPIHASLAHVTGNGNLEKPFGSQRWHDDARTTWSLEEKGEHRILTCRKNNFGPYLQPLEISVRGWSRPEHFGGQQFPTGIREAPYALALADLIHDVMTDPMTYKQATEAVNDGLEDPSKGHKEAAVKKAILRAQHLFVRAPESTHQRPVWKRRSTDEEPEEPET